MPDDKTRKYFEVFGDTLNLVNIFKLISLIALILCVFLLVLLLKTSGKPPIVIRVDGAGNPSIVEIKNSSNISPQEVRNFAAYFVEYWRGWDFYKYDDHFSRVFTMMTQRMQESGNGYLQSNAVVEKIKTGKLKYKILPTGVVVKSCDKRYAVVEITGMREESDYTDGARKKEVRFVATLSLVVVSRSVSPWGLLADSYDERAFD